MKTLRKLWKDERGTETVEWAIILGIIAVGAIALMGTIGTWVQNSFQGLADAVTAGP